MSVEISSDYKKWEKKFNGESELHDRQDADMDIYNLDAFVLKDHDGTKIDDAYNLTSNQPQVFADRIIGGLSTSALQVRISYKDKEKCSEASDLENTLRLLYSCIDAYLALRKDPPLLNILAGQIAIRGGVSGLVWPFDDDGELVIHAPVWDRRYMAYTVGRKGIDIAGYKIKKDSDSIYADYGYETKDDADVVDLWNSRENRVYINGEDKVKPLKVDLKKPYTPVIVHECGASAWHRDTGYSKYVGESVYTHVRDLIVGYNRLLTILNTLNMRAFTNGLQFPNAGGANAKVDPGVRDDNTVNAIGQNDRFYAMPLNDIQQATMMLKNILDQLLVYGMLPLMEYGDMSDQETVAQITTKAAKTNSVFLPRRVAIEMYYDDLAIMLLTQLAERKLPSEINIKGKITKVPAIPKDLSEYTIKHKLNIINPQQDIANAALAQALAPFMSLEYLLERIIQVDDPLKVITQKDKDDVERMMPQIKAYRVMAEKLKGEEPTDIAEGHLIYMQLGIDAEPGAAGKDIKPGAAEYPGRPIAPLTK